MWNALLAPLAAIPLFFFRDYDVLILSVMVLMLNLWVAWVQLDGADDEYTWAQYYKDAATARAAKESIASMWQTDKIAQGAYETMSMLADPITHQTFGGMYK